MIAPTGIRVYCSSSNWRYLEPVASSDKHTETAPSDPQFDSARRASAAWWQGPKHRPLLRATAPLDPSDPPAAWDDWRLVGDPERLEDHLTLHRQLCDKTYYTAQAVPYLNINLAPGILATYLTGYLKPGEGTVWVEQPHDWAEIERMRLRLTPDNFWWDFTRRATERTILASAGRIIPAVTDLGGAMDTLAAIRGTGNLLADLYDCPGRVKAMSARVLDWWHEAFDALAAPILGAFGGTVDRWGYFSPGRHYPIQCDFAAMLSPAMFAEFVLPGLEEQCRRLEHSIYHLDGPGQVGHLDMLLGIDRLEAIQWVPGAALPDADDAQWFPMYQKIQRAGKALVLPLPPEKVEWMLGQLDGQLVLSRRHMGSAAEADEFVRKVEELSCCRPARS